MRILSALCWVHLLTQVHDGHVDENHASPLHVDVLLFTCRGILVYSESAGVSVREADDLQGLHGNNNSSSCRCLVG